MWCELQRKESKKLIILKLILFYINQGVYLGTTDQPQKEDVPPGDRGASQDKPFLNLKITKNGGEWF